MKVLILSDDKSIFNSESAAYQEIFQCSELVDQLHVIVFTSRKNPHLFLKVTDKLFLYPTNSTSRLLVLRDVFKIVRSQIFWQSHLLAQLICAQNSFLAAFSAHLLSWKYKRNYLIDIYNESLLTRSRSAFMESVRGKILDRIFAKSSGIRVSSQILGEMISARNPLLGDRIFILPFLDTEKNLDGAILESPAKIDVRKLFPQFNIILISVKKIISKKDIKRALSIVNFLRLRYPHLGLVIDARIRDYFWHLFFIHTLPDYIVMETNTDKNISYYHNANIYIDVSKGDDNSHELIRAIHAGYPVVTSGTAANASIVQDGKNGFIADPRKPELFARKIMEILETPGLREMMRLYRYDVTDLYGRDPRDYYKRLVAIWQKCQTVEEEVFAESPLVEKESVKTDFYPAFTLNIVRKVFDRFIENKKEKSRPLYIYDREEILDVDSIKLGIKEALEEIEAAGEL